MKNELNLYTLNGDKVVFNNYTYFDAGSCAQIFKNDNKLLKIYKSDCLYKFYITKRLFTKLKELNLKNIVHLDNYYYFNNSPRINKLLPPECYTMEYIEKNNIKILEEPKDYLLETINSLENTCNILALNKILIFDAHNTNIIFNKKGAVLIDVDTYQISNLMTYKKILLHNKKEILYFIRSKLNKDYKNLENELNKINFILDHILYNLNKHNGNLTNEFNNIFIKSDLYKSIK